MNRLLSLTIVCLLTLAAGCAAPGSAGTTAPAPTAIPINTQPAPAVTPTLIATPAAAAVVTAAPCKRIAFTLYSTNSADVAGGADLYSICSDGSGLRRVTSAPGAESAPAWGLDGNQIAFASTRAGKSQIFIVPGEGGEPKQLTTDLSNDLPVWLPGGWEIAFRTTDGQGLWWWRILYLDSGVIKALSEKSYDFFFQTPAWSPDGSGLAFMSLEEQKERNDGSSQIHVRSVKSGLETALTHDTWANISPVWSPDSRRIAFLSERDGFYNQFALYVMDADGSDLQRLTTPDYSEVVSFSWSGDGQEIAICSGTQGGQGGIEIIDVNTREKRPLEINLPGASVCHPAWQP